LEQSGETKLGEHCGYGSTLENVGQIPVWGPRNIWQRYWV